MSRVICIAGNLGAGKTTLVRSLARKLGWQTRPAVGYDVTYLEDLFRNPGRWSFEAQMAFLSHKANSIKEAIKNGIDFVVDRSIYEDVAIFAQLFANMGMMDSRAYATYDTYANFILEEMPVPIAIIYCKCPPEICEKRLAGRPRPYQSLFPQGHIMRLHNRHEEWVSNFNLCPLFALDTNIYNTTNPDVIGKIVQDLTILLSSNTSQKAKQLELFPTPLTDLSNNQSAHILQPLNTVNVDNVTKLYFYQTRPAFILPSSLPSVYIAAPFSGVAANIEPSDTDNSHNLRLIDVPRQHGIIPPGRYRSVLTSLSKAFEHLGYQAILPHRDVNRWGKKELTPKEVGQGCKRLVKECSLFFGILGTSYGAHVEAGMAMALSKPTILVAVEGEQETFMARALRDSGFAVSLKVNKLEELISLINSPAFQDILDYAGAIVRKRN